MALVGADAISLEDRSRPVGADGRAFQRTVKLLFDVASASCAFLLLLPLFAIVAALIWFEGRSVIFAHSRVGQDGKSFKCLKFRTMALNSDEILQKHLAENADAAEQWATHRKLTNDPRLTKIGGFLRETSLDELPQLINVIRGDMSIVGPRPVVTAELEKYGAYAEHYLAVRPGITGLWQVSGRSNVDYNTRVALDRDYVENWSFSGDIRIIFKTVAVVLRRDGAM